MIIEDEIAEDMHRIGILEFYRNGGAIERQAIYPMVAADRFWEPIRNGNFDFVNYRYRKMKR